MLKLAVYHPSASGFSSTTEVGSKTLLPVLSDGLHEFQKALGSTHIFPIDMYKAAKIFLFVCFSNNSPTIFFQVGYDMAWPKRTESFPVGELLLYNTLVRYRFCTLAGFPPMLSKVPSFHLIKAQKRLEVFFSWALDGASLKGLHNPLLQFTDSTCWCMQPQQFFFIISFHLCSICPFLCVATTHRGCPILLMWALQEEEQ